MPGAQVVISKAGVKNTSDFATWYITPLGERVLLQPGEVRKFSGPEFAAIPTAKTGIAQALRDVGHVAEAAVKGWSLALSGGFAGAAIAVAGAVAKTEAQRKQEDQAREAAEEERKRQEAEMSMMGNNGFDFSGLIGQVIGGVSSIIASRNASKASSPNLAFPAIGPMVGRAMTSLPAVLPAAGAVVRGAIGAGRGLLSAANRWCMRNPKTCASLGGAGIVADMMRSGEIKRPGRRINPLNVRAARRALRRIKAVRKITAQIERALPRRAAPRAAVMHATPSRLFHAAKR